MLQLSDTTVRVYRKKNGDYSFRLSGHLLVLTNASFSLDAYLRDIRCILSFASGESVSMECSYTVDTMAQYVMNAMVHRFWASGSSRMENLYNTIGKLRLDYHISFTGHEAEEPDFIEYLVPVIVKANTYKGQ